MICSLSQRNISHVALDNLFRHVGRTVEHDVLARKPVQLLNLLEELDGLADVIYSLYNFHLKRFISRIQALIYLLQSQESFGSKCVEVKVWRWEDGKRKERKRES
jgi:hypothetical protein